MFDKWRKRPCDKEVRQERTQKTWKTLKGRSVKKRRWFNGGELKLGTAGYSGRLENIDGARYRTFERTSARPWDSSEAIMTTTQVSTTPGCGRRAE